MLDHIHIENFRLFKELDIPKVGQVNLITGKNNVGKTTLLEGLRIYQNINTPLNPNGQILSIILQERGDINGDYLRSYDTLFNGHKIVVSYGEHTDELRIFKINDVVISIKDTNNVVFSRFALEDTKMTFFEISDGKYDASYFISSRFERANSELWKQIELTEKEEQVVEILRILEPRITRISVNDADGSAKVRLKSLLKPLPLRNFGEGMSRLLTIALGLVSAENDMLLIDEIDLGLHHSVQHTLWEIVFQNAKDLNVQVFATTHSSDCVEAFSDIANKPECVGMGNYIRLQRSKKDGNIMAVDYEMEQLGNALDLNSETR